MGMHSKRKGKVGEREAAELLRRFGFEARRGVQFQGGLDSPDVVHSIPNVHIEVKRCEALQIYAAVEQARADANGKMPVVLHRRNGQEWLAIMPAENFLATCYALVRAATKS